MVGRRRADERPTHRVHQDEPRGLRLLPVLQLSVLSRVLRRAGGAGQSNPCSHGGTRSRDWPVDLSSDLSRRPRADVQQRRGTTDDSGGGRQSRRARRGGRNRIRNSAAHPAGPFSSEIRRHRPLCAVHRPYRSKQGLQRAVHVLSASAAGAAERPGLSARGQGTFANSGSSAHQAPGISRRRRQVRRAGSGRPADHAVVLREPLDGGARGVGAGQAGAGQRPVRGAARPEHPQPCGVVLRKSGRVCRNAESDRGRPDPQRRARRQRPGLLRPALCVAGDRRKISRHAAAAGWRRPRRWCPG